MYVCIDLFVLWLCCCWGCCDCLWHSLWGLPNAAAFKCNESRTEAAHGCHIPGVSSILRI